MSTRIVLNRDFELPSDGWCQIEPKGEHPNHAAGVVQVIDDAACAAIANRFNEDADAGKLSHGREMLIDHEHFKHDQDKETRAYGWLTRLQNRSDGLYGQIRWTGTGKQAVENGDYRFFSTEYDPADLQILNDGKLRRVRPIRLDGLTLTNEPNNRGQRPITNRAGAEIMPGDFDKDVEQALVIMNRAEQLQRQTPGLSLLGATRMARNELAGAVINQGQRLRCQVPGLSLATATAMAQKDEASRVMNRALELRQRNPAMSLAAVTLAAQREVVSSLMNRARKLREQTPGLSVGTALVMARHKEATAILNRAGEFRKKTPSLSLPTAIIMAQRELGVPIVETN
jgi:phage I-like protein